MREALVSVVITSYRRERRIVFDAVKSVLNQTYSPIEIILVDDNGTDSEYSEMLLEISNDYPEVTYWHNKENSGAQISRNNGILASKGEFIAFLDDDDMWEKTKIEKQMSFFTSDDIGMVYCDGYSFEDGDRNKLRTFREVSLWDRPISHKLELFNDYIGSTSQALIRRECFAKVGLFDTDMPARQDYEMWLRISQKYKIVGCPEKLLYYRVHVGERISTNWQKCFISYQLLLEKYSASYRKFSYAKAKLILRMYKAQKNMGNTGNALKYFGYAFVTNPVCVMDVVNRRIRKQEFNDYYKKLVDHL